MLLYSLMYLKIISLLPDDAYMKTLLSEPGISEMDK